MNMQKNTLHIDGIYKSSAPASIKLMGEYAVLHNYPAIACAVDYRASITLTPRIDKKITIKSALGNLCINMNLIKVTPPFHYVLQSIKYFYENITHGFDLVIDSTFSSTIGLGSSGAVTVACAKILATWLNIKLDKRELFKICYQIVLDVQQEASGIDIAASIYGGIISYTKDPFEVIPLNNTPDLVLVYSGEKTITTKSLSLVKGVFQDIPELESKLYELIGICVKNGKTAIIRKDWNKLGKLFNIHNGLQEALCTGNKDLSRIYYELIACKEIKGAKISGSGFGDCIVAIGLLSDDFVNNATIFKNTNFVNIPIKISKSGVL